MSAVVPAASDFIGREIGRRTVEYVERDAILYALSVGARADDLSLVDEQRLRVLPTFALTLAQWAPDALGGLDAWEVGNALHGAQQLTVLAELPRSGAITMTARVGAVHDKGSAAVYDVVVESEFFRAAWSVFAPGRGGFGGDRGPARPAEPSGEPTWSGSRVIPDNQAALYRLSGDWHRIHIDPDAAQKIGMKRPILQGLSTLASSVLSLAESVGAHPADLEEVSGRFASPVYPGTELRIRRWGENDFDASTDEGVAISAGTVTFASPS